jgi:trigger factor
VTRAELEAAIESEDGFATGTHVHEHDHDHDHQGHDHDHAGHEPHDHDHGIVEDASAPAEVAATATEVNEADVTPGDFAQSAPAKPKRTRKPIAKDANAGAEVAPGDTPAPARKSRAKKTAEG